MDPATKSMKRKETGNAVVAKQPRRVLRVLKEVSSLSAVRMVSSAFLRLLIFLPAILILVLLPAQRFS